MLSARAMRATSQQQCEILVSRLTKQLSKHSAFIDSLAFKLKLSSSQYR